MPAASSRWRRAPRIPRSIGSSRRCAASSRSTTFTFRRGLRARCARIASPSRSIATSTQCSTAAPHRSPAGRARGSTRASARSIANCSSAGIATAWKSTTARRWLAGFTASRSAAPSSARACSIVRATPRRSRSCISIARLRAGGFRLCDTQFVTEHLKIFGAIEVPKQQYHKLLEASLAGEGDFAALGIDRPVTGAEALARLARRNQPPVRSAGPEPESAAGAVASAADAWAPPAALRPAWARRASVGNRLRRGRGSDRRRLTVRQPDVIDRVLDPVQAGARGKHPAGEDALDLALQRHLVDLDEGVGVRRLGRRAGVAGARRHLQRAELHGLADRHVEIDDAAGDLVEAGEQRALVDDLLRRRLDDHLVAGLQCAVGGRRWRPARRKLAGR